MRYLLKIFHKNKILSRSTKQFFFFFEDSPYEEYFLKDVIERRLVDCLQGIDTAEGSQRSR